MDEVMRGMKVTHGQSPFARFRMLPVWVGVVEVGNPAMNSRRKRQ